MVAGRSAEGLLDRDAGRGRSTGCGGVQMWGEPDHYMIGQIAGRKVVSTLDLIETTKESTRPDPSISQLQPHRDHLFV